MPPGFQPWPQGAWAGGGAMLDDEVRWGPQEKGRKVQTNLRSVIEMRDPIEMLAAPASLAAEVITGGKTRLVQAAVLLGMNQTFLV